MHTMNTNRLNGCSASKRRLSKLLITLLGTIGSETPDHFFYCIRPAILNG